MISTININTKNKPAFIQRLSYTATAIFVFVACILLPGLSDAQNFSQMIKLIENDRETKSSAARSTNDNFGYTVAISGDYAVVGANLEDENASGSNTLSAAGSIFVFVRSGGNWSLQQKLVANDRAAGDWFGSSVAISGDYIIVGAQQEDEDTSGVNTLTDAGSA